MKVLVATYVAMGLFAARALFEVVRSRYLAAGPAAGYSDRHFGTGIHLAISAEAGSYFR